MTDKLPPLPAPHNTHCFDDDTQEDVWSYSADQMRSYARAAILAEREACAKLCEATPPYPFRPSLEAAHAIRARS